MPKLESISLSGFKSIAQLESFPLGDVNILIGANGAGKSNFIDLFRMLAAIGSGGFQNYVLESGADTLFHHGPKSTPEISTRLDFGDNSYAFTLAPAAEEKVYFKKESVRFKETWKEIGSANLEPSLYTKRNEAGHYTRKGVNGYVLDAISTWKIYHFHDTSRLAPMRRKAHIDRDWPALESDAGNLAPFLWRLKRKNLDHYSALVKIIQRIAPYFEDFVFQPEFDPGANNFSLSWKQKGSSQRMNAQQFSDGTLRFICLATALLQPNPPATLILDEPELGLHPGALSLLSGLIETAASRMQLVVATQSPVFLSDFAPKDIITVDQVNGASTFKRLDENSLQNWLEEYSLGDIWQKGIISGGIDHA